MKRSRSTLQTHAREDAQENSYSSSSSSSSGEFMTPLPSHRSPRNYDTPARVARIEEKNEFASLNKRLEYYILCQKERDASSHGMRVELAALRDRARQDSAELQELYESKLQSTTRAKEKLGADVAHLHDENGRLSREVAELRAALDRINDEANRTDQGAKEKAKELKKLQQLNIELNDKLAQLQHDLTVARDANAHLQSSLNDARNAASTTSKKMITEQSQAKIQIEKNTVKIVGLEQELADCKAELADLLKGRAGDEARLRAEFGQQLRDLLADKHAEHSQAMDDLRDSLKNTYNARLRDVNEDLDAAKREIETEKRRTAEVMKKVTELKALVMDATAQKAALSDENKQLQEALRNQADRHADELADLNRELDIVKDAYRGKLDEITGLMDDKITLGMEIKQYRELLEQEEQRLGMHGHTRYADNASSSSSSSSSKSSRSKGPGNASSSSSSSSVTSTTSVSVSSNRQRTSADTAHSVIITGIDLEGTMIKLRNGSVDRIPLKNWKIRTKKGRNEFQFPANLVAEPGQVLTIHLGEDAKKRLTSASDLAWSLDGVFHPKGDNATLYNENEVAVSRVEFLKR